MDSAQAPYREPFHESYSIRARTGIYMHGVKWAHTYSPSTAGIPIPLRCSARVSFSRWCFFVAPRGVPGYRILARIAAANSSSNSRGRRGTVHNIFWCPRCSGRPTRSCWSHESRSFFVVWYGGCVWGVVWVFFSRAKSVWSVSKRFPI